MTLSSLILETPNFEFADNLQTVFGKEISQTAVD